MIGNFTIYQQKKTVDINGDKYHPGIQQHLLLKKEVEESEDFQTECEDQDKKRVIELESQLNVIKDKHVEMAHRLEYIVGALKSKDGSLPDIQNYIIPELVKLKDQLLTMSDTKAENEEKI